MTALRRELLEELVRALEANLRANDNTSWQRVLETLRELREVSE